MSRTGNVLHAFVVGVALMAFLCPSASGAQQITSLVQSPSSEVTTFAPSAKVGSQLLRPTTPNPFERPGSTAHKAADDTDSPDSLLMQRDRGRLSTSAAYAFTAPPSFYSFGHNQSVPADWNSSVSGAISATVNQSGTTAVRMSSDLEIDGQRRDAAALGAPGTQALTMEWEVSRLLPTRLGPLEVAAGRYQQRFVSYPAFANGPLTDVLLGYSASSVGFETTFTLPDKNMALSFRYGTERLGSLPDKSRTAIFEFSWTW
jgi:hypothetical protein